MPALHVGTGLNAGPAPTCARSASRAASAFSRRRLSASVSPRRACRRATTEWTWQQQLERHCRHMRSAHLHQVTLCCT